ncbi:MAG: MobA/MobL family protein [Anaerostipes sp.]|nr:MobA/MobL family protein [Anaerostipes sp.]
MPNVKGRIYYISSPVRQENLYAVYETTERSFWTELAKCNQTEFTKSGTAGKCIEARELIIALPESFVEYGPKALLKLFTEHFKQNYGTECIAALHHNKRKTNYHIHLIFSERKLLEIPTEKVATRNMFYDECGKHVRTKKEILDDSGQIRAGCKVIPKGEVYERNLFTTKNSRFKGEKFLDDVKHSYTDLINLYVRNDKEKLKVFDRNGVYLPMKKIGKNNPKTEQIKTDNEMRCRWNETVDMALVCGIPEQKIMEVKQEQISKKVSQSMRLAGKRPDLFAGIVQMAITALKLLINRIFCMEEPEEAKSEKTGANAPKIEAKTEQAQNTCRTDGKCHKDRAEAPRTT